MEAARPQKFLIVESDSKYAAWLQHAIGVGWPNDSIVIMDWSSFARVRTAMTGRDYDIVLLALKFDEGYEEPTTDGLEWIRKLRQQAGFPEMIVLADGGSELTAVRSLRLGAADYLPKRLLTPPRLTRALKLTLRGIEKLAQRNATRAPAGVGAGASAEPRQAPATVSHRATHTGAGSGLAKAAKAALAEPASKPHISTHTGAGSGLAQAAKVALASEPAPKPHISTHTGASLARAAQSALANHPTPGATPPTTPETSAPAAAPEPPPKSHFSTHTGAALAQAARAAVVPAPEPRAAEADELPKPQVKDSRQVAPEIHQIPGYTLLQKIGESEAAAVYLAISEDIGHNVALKVSKRKHSAGDPNDTGERGILFQREFEAIAALDHPSIIDLFDYGIHEGVEYLAMEYFPCGDLKARLQNPLTADEAIAFLREIARSLQVVHDSGVIHRDLKPPNVMLRDDGSVVLIDFGLARSLLAGDGSTRTGVLRGSPYYMSPEQAQGEVLDARTDIYSLGVMLYEMLAGRKPYLGASAIDVLQQHVMAPVPELPVHHLFYQPLLERLMSKSREHRIASCEELLSAIEQMMLALGERGASDPRALVAAAADS